MAEEGKMKMNWNIFSGIMAIIVFFLLATFIIPIYHKICDWSDKYHEKKNQ